MSEFIKTKEVYTETNENIEYRKIYNPISKKYEYIKISDLLNSIILDNNKNELINKELDIKTKLLKKFNNAIDTNINIENISNNENINYIPKEEIRRILNEIEEIKKERENKENGE